MWKVNLFPDIAEQRVESMLEQGRKIVRDAIELYKPIAIFGAFSGGNDSIVTTHFACEEFAAAAVHCNTLIGVEKSHQHARDVAKKFEWDLIEKRAEAEGPPERHRDGTPFDGSRLPNGRWVDGATQYEEMVFNFGMPGPGQHPRAYQRLKEKSFDAVRREAKAGKKTSDCVMFISGIRHDESSIRAGYQTAVRKNGGSIWVNPFYWQTAADFEFYRQEFGLPRNRVSDTVGISGECLCGTMANDPAAELAAVEAIEPDTAAYIRGLEAKAESLGLPCRWGHRPPGASKPCDPNQLLLWGDEPEFMPACVGCLRRKA